MSYVFDSSSIYALLSKPSVLGGNYTLTLAKFELGNIVWREVFLHRRIGREEGLKLISFVSKVLDTMNLEDVNSAEVVEIATDYGITFYDASYVRLARKLDLPLVTEDNKLMKAVKGKVEVLSAKDIK
ncbi:MAG: type II toxin-antitoxin system VapC family toxin [Sulfolobaceae archaeon]